MPTPELHDDPFNLESYIRECDSEKVDPQYVSQRPVVEMRVGPKKSGRSSSGYKQNQISRKNSNRRNGHWVTQQNKRYHWFLQIYHKHFMNKHLRRIDRIFKIMENFLETRQAEQCRSHHQKMEKRHGNFSKILLHLRKQHYNIESTDQMREQMFENGVELIDGILSSAQLNNNINKQENPQSPEQVGNLEDDLLHLKEQSKHIQNLLNDNYEDGIELHDFMNP